MDTDGQPGTPPRPPGDYAIVELFGHQTLVGRVAEVERFGTKFLAIEPLFCGELLDVCLHGGAAIYRLTPCSVEVAFKKQPTWQYQLPSSISSIVPPLLLEASTKRTAIHDYEERGGDVEEPTF